MNEQEARKKFMHDVRNLTAQIDGACNKDPQNKDVLFIFVAFAPALPGGGCVVTTNGVAKGDVVTILKDQSELLAAQLVPNN